MARILKIFKTQCYVIALLIGFLILFPVLSIICLPIYLFRFTVSICSKIFRPDLGRMLTTRSAPIAIDDPTNNSNWNLCVWFTLEDNLDFHQFRENFLHKIIYKRDLSGELLYPEFQQYYHKWLGFLFWKWEKNFDITEHIRYYFPLDESPTTRVTTEDELRNIIKSLTALPFKVAKSPWEFLFLPNYLQNGKSSAKQSILLFRSHHGLCDGYAILWLLAKEVNNFSLEKIAKPIVFKRNFLSKIFSILIFWLRAPYQFVNLMVESNDKNDWHLPLNKLERPFGTAFTDRIPLAYIKDIRKANNVSFTTVILASLAGGLRNMMLEKGIKVPEYVTTGIALPMPGHPNNLCNYFIFSFMKLPVGTSDPQKRIAKVEKNYQSLKRSSVTKFNFAIIPLFGGLFTWMIDWFSSNEFSTVLTSNFPGPQETMYFIGGGGNNRVVDLNFSAGMGKGNVGIGFCMLSYDNRMRIITSVAKSILPSDSSVNELNQKIINELEILRKLN